MPSRVRHHHCFLLLPLLISAAALRDTTASSVSSQHQLHPTPPLDQAGPHSKPLSIAKTIDAGGDLASPPSTATAGMTNLGMGKDGKGIEPSPTTSRDKPNTHQQQGGAAPPLHSQQEQHPFPSDRAGPQDLQLEETSMSAIVRVGDADEQQLPPPPAHKDEIRIKVPAATGTTIRSATTRIEFAPPTAESAGRSIENKTDDLHAAQAAALLGDGENQHQHQYHQKGPPPPAHDQQHERSASFWIHLQSQRELNRPSSLDRAVVSGPQLEEEPFANVNIAVDATDFAQQSLLSSSAGDVVATNNISKVGKGTELPTATSTATFTAASTTITSTTSSMTSATITTVRQRRDAGDCDWYRTRLCCSGNCVTSHAINDGANDCEDNSDETYPAFQCTTSLFPFISILKRHADNVNDVAFSSDSTMFVSGSTDGTAQVWSVSSKQVLSTLISSEALPYRSACTSVAFSPDGSTVATGFKAGLVVWKWKAEQVLFKIEMTKSGKWYGAYSLSFSPDGTMIAAVGALTAYIFSVGGQNQVGELDVTGNYGNAPPNMMQISFSLDSKLVAVTSHGNSETSIWSASSRKLVTAYDHREGGGVTAVAVAFSPVDVNMLVAGDRGGRITYFDVAKKKVIARIFAPGCEGNNCNHYYSSISFTSDGKQFAVASDQRDVQVWDYNSRKMVAEIQNVFDNRGGDGESLVLSPDGTMLLAVSDEHVTMKLFSKVQPSSSAPLPLNVGIVGAFNTKSVEYDNYRPRSGSVYSVVFSPDGTMFAAGGDNRGGDDEPSTVTIYSTKTLKPVHIISATSLYSGDALTFSPDSKFIAWISMNGEKVVIWSIADQKEFYSRQVCNHFVMSVAFDGEMLFVGCYDAIQCISVSDDQVVASLKGTENLGFTLSPDGATLASVGGGEVQLWSTSSKTKIATLKGASACVVLSMDGAYIASRDAIRNVVKIWSSKSKKLVSTLEGGHSYDGSGNGIKSLAFSMDGTMIASAGGPIVQVWSLKTKTVVATIVVDDEDTNEVSDIAFSPDGKTLLTGSFEDNRPVKLWNAATCTPGHYYALSGSTFEITKGSGCRLSEDDTCASSLNYPANYGNYESCTFNAPKGVTLDIVAFETEESYDELAVNGKAYSGNGDALAGIVLSSGAIAWSSDGSQTATGWKVCIVQESITCADCPANTYQNELNHRKNECTTQPTCDKGKFISTDTKTAARTCSDCPANTYQKESTHRTTECTAQITCDKGELINDDSKTAARICSDCPANTYQKASGHRTTECTAQTTCDKGTFISADSNTAARFCSECPANTYMSSSSHRIAACIPQTTCGEDEYISEDSKTAARTCTVCPQNAYQAAASHRKTECGDTSTTTTGTSTTTITTTTVTQTSTTVSSTTLTVSTTTISTTTSATSTTISSTTTSATSTTVSSTTVSSTTSSLTSTTVSSTTLTVSSTTISTTTSSLTSTTISTTTTSATGTSTTVSSTTISSTTTSATSTTTSATSTTVSSTTVSSTTSSLTSTTVSSTTTSASSTTVTQTSTTVSSTTTTTITSSTTTTTSITTSTTTTTSITSSTTTTTTASSTTTTITSSTTTTTTITTSTTTSLTSTTTTVSSTTTTVTSSTITTTTITTSTTTSLTSTTTTVTSTTSTTTTTATFTTTTTPLHCSAGEFWSTTPSFNVLNADLPQTMQASGQFCHSCPSGQYQPAQTHRLTACIDQPFCGQGERITLPTTTTKQACLPCQANTFQPLSQHQESTCQAQPTCSAGQFISADSSITEQSCTPCLPFTFQPRQQHREPSCQQATVATCSNAGTFSSISGMCSCNAVASLRNPDCSCLPGYTGETCGSCAEGTHYRVDAILPSTGNFDQSLEFECVPKFDACNLGELFNTLTEECEPCPINTYADSALEAIDFGRRIMCTPCPDEFQQSPTGSTTLLSCKYKFRSLNSSVAMSRGFCTGTDYDEETQETLHFTSIASASDCKNYADTKGYTFAANPPECGDAIEDAEERCTEKVCNLLENMPEFGLPTKSGEYLPASAACKLTCGLCDPKWMESVGSAGRLAPPSGCVLEGGANLGNMSRVRYYDSEASRRFLGNAYLPVCEVFRCNGTFEEVVSDATQDSLPVCDLDQLFDAYYEDLESNTYTTFYIVLGCLLFVLVFVAYSLRKECCCRKGSTENVLNCRIVCTDDDDPSCCCLKCTGGVPEKVHRLVWLGLVARLSDMATDWAFLLVNIEGERFIEESADGFWMDPKLYTRAAWIICIIGTALTPLDMLSKAPSLRREAETDDNSFCFKSGNGEGDGMGLWFCRLGRRAATIIALLVMISEDIPQLIITLIFAERMTLSKIDAQNFDVATLSLTALNILISLISLGFNLYLVATDFYYWKSEKELEEWYIDKANRMAENTKNPEAISAYETALRHKLTMLKRQERNTDAVIKLQRDLKQVIGGPTRLVTKIRMYQDHFGYRPIEIVLQRTFDLNSSTSDNASARVRNNSVMVVPPEEMRRVSRQASTESSYTLPAVSRQSSFAEDEYLEVTETAFTDGNPDSQRSNAVTDNFAPAINTLVGLSLRRQNRTESVNGFGSDVGTINDVPTVHRHSMVANSILEVAADNSLSFAAAARIANRLSAWRKRAQTSKTLV